MDSQVVMVALQKGRFSAPSLGFLARQAVAFTLACAWGIRYADMPSESNPADAPSRGKHMCLTRQRPGKVIRRSVSSPTSKRLATRSRINSKRAENSPL